MRILFLTTAHNSLSQRLWIELTERGHAIRVCIAATSEAMIAAVAAEAPDLIIAPMLKIAIPKEIWFYHLCLIVHPGIRGDRGPSSLDWAITNGETEWGVTMMEATDEFDAGQVWSFREFPMAARSTSKSSLYRGSVTEAAVQCAIEAVALVEAGRFGTSIGEGTLASPQKSDAIRGCLRPPMRQADRLIDWTRDKTATILQKIHAADSAPGVLGSLLGKTCYFYGAHEEEQLQGPPGKILAHRDGAICIGTLDGAVWISHLKAKEEASSGEILLFDPSFHKGDAPRRMDLSNRVAGIKLPATQVLGALLIGVPDAALLLGVPEAALPIDAPKDYRTFREIAYWEEDEVGFLSFDFYNGAMSTSQCTRLRAAFRHARSRPTKVIVLLGGSDFWSNGIHLNVIEANPEPGAESWSNINAMDDLVLEILNTMSHLVIAGMRGNAGAGGAILALAADHVYARSGIVLNPHYRSMGELYGSEYWTYVLPRRVGQKRALELTTSCLPIGTDAAKEMGFLDDAFGDDLENFEAELKDRARRLARDPNFSAMLGKKQEQRLEDERVKPLALYRAEELAHMRVNFFGPDPAYHEARRRFVFKGKAPAARVPLDKAV
jgi:putative two-component system hydrogenase maturation factor HypX/HoxX